MHSPAVLGIYYTHPVQGEGAQFLQCWNALRVAETLS